MNEARQDLPAAGDTENTGRDKRRRRKKRKAKALAGPEKERNRRGGGVIRSKKQVAELHRLAFITALEPGGRFCYSGAEPRVEPIYQAAGFMGTNLPKTLYRAIECKADQWKVEEEIDEFISQS